MVTMSPSSRYTTSRVCAITAAASDPTNVSPFSPTPIRSGLPRRAATILLGSRVETTAIPYVPSICPRAASTARSSDPCARPSPRPDRSPLRRRGRPVRPLAPPGRGLSGALQRSLRAPLAPLEHLLDEVHQHLGVRFGGE